MKIPWRKITGTPGIKRGAAGWEVRTLPLCYCVFFLWFFAGFKTLKSGPRQVWNISILFGKLTERRCHPGPNGKASPSEVQRRKHIHRILDRIRGPNGLEKNQNICFSYVRNYSCYSLSKLLVAVESDFVINNLRWMYLVNILQSLDWLKSLGELISSSYLSSTALKLVQS